MNLACFSKDISEFASTTEVNLNEQNLHAFPKPFRTIPSVSNNFVRLKKLKLLLLLLVTILGSVNAQNEIKGPVTPGQQMPEFVLQTYQGPKFDVNDLKGKNVLLIFLRGLVGKDHWCQICHYSYVQLIDLENKMQIRQKYNLEIAFVLPYDKDTVTHWVSIIPDQLKVIEGWKSPANPDKLDNAGKQWMGMARKLFPVAYEIRKDNIKTPFPILMDSDQSVSKGLGLYTTNWDGGLVPQDIPTVVLIDKTGKVVFKYLSQNTLDRPSYEYLTKIFDSFLLN